MPAMTDAVVKKADGTTDITYQAMQGATGDQGPAVWRQNAGQTAPFSMRPTMRLKIRDNGPKTARIAEILIIQPYVVTGTDGVTRKVHQVVDDRRITVPQEIPYASILEFVHQSCNLQAHTNVKDAVSIGFAPTT